MWSGCEKSSEMAHRFVLSQTEWRFLGDKCYSKNKQWSGLSNPVVFPFILEHTEQEDPQQIGKDENKAKNKTESQFTMSKDNTFFF